MKSNLIILFSLAIFLFACEDHNHNDTATGTVNLVIKAKFGTEPLEICIFWKGHACIYKLRIFSKQYNFKGKPYPFAFYNTIYRSR